MAVVGQAVVAPTEPIARDALDAVSSIFRIVVGALLAVDDIADLMSPLLISVTMAAASLLWKFVRFEF